MRLSTLALLLVMGVTAALAPSPARALTAGDPAPDFVATDVQGGPAIHMSAYRGKVVVLTFFWVY